MSQHFADTEIPSLWSCVTALSSASGSRAPITTLQPFAANSRAIPSPIPRLPPVTTAVLPASSSFMQWMLILQTRIHHGGTETRRKFRIEDQYFICCDRSLESKLYTHAGGISPCLRASVVNRF